MKWMLLALSLVPGATTMAAVVSAQAISTPTQQAGTSDSWQLFASLALTILGPASLWYMRKMNADLKDAKATIPQKVDPLNAKVGALESRVSSLEYDLKQRTKQLDEANLQTDSYRHENRILREDLTVQKIARDELTRNSAKQAEQIVELTKTTTRQAEEILALTQQIESYKDVNALGKIVLEGMSELHIAFREMLELVKHSTGEQRIVSPETKPAT